MPEDANDSKAKKLAAARKKLKEYQTKEKRGNDTNGGSSTGTLENLTSGATSATLSEKSDSDLNLNGNTLESTGEMTPLGEQLAEGTASTIPQVMEAAVLNTNDAATVGPGILQSSVAEEVPLAASYFNSLPNTGSLSPTPNFKQIFQEISNVATDSNEFGIAQPQQSPIQQQNNFNTIQLLITEKAQLNSELSKFRTTCRERDLEIEELRTEFAASQRRFDELQQHYITQQQALQEMRLSNTTLQEQLANSLAKCEDLSSHLTELKLQFRVSETRLQTIEQQYKEKCSELELSQIRINQLSDESCISKDNRVETLTQTQFMYEQQIRDLQAMVQQLTHDKDQANTQYQHYVQHLNTEVTNVNERILELTEENSKLQEREQQLIEHVSGLERGIQRNIARQDQFRANENIKDQSLATNTKTELEAEIAKLKEIISEFDFERHEFQLKIKSQEDRLVNNVREQQQRQQLITELEEQLDSINSEQPDKTKLLATMESDKIAASRALTQNFELKKQLDELELRFVQLTNDKAELMNKLDAEEYANRELHNSYTQMEEKLHSIDERFKFKDEEMIRLSHENEDLARNNLMLQQQVDQLKHYEVREYSERFGNDEEISPFLEEKHDHDHHDHQHNHQQGHHHQEHEHHDHQHDHRDHQHDHDHNVHNHSEKFDNTQETENYITQADSDSCQEAKENQINSCDQHEHAVKLSKAPLINKHYHHRSITPQLATNEAVQKLQQRFTQLMSQVADLTEEKQRLEHLVLQLQSETETIGEYITLYQTQRRILKQREYEKAAQMQLLQAEREKMQEKISMLNNLVTSLGVELPNNKRIAEHLNNALAENISIEPGNNGKQHLASATQQEQQEEMAINQKLNIAESQEILTKIQSIITEIKENTKDIPLLHEVDHLNCCLGKFEVV